MGWESGGVDKAGVEEVRAKQNVRTGHEHRDEQCLVGHAAILCLAKTEIDGRRGREKREGGMEFRGKNSKERRARRAETGR